MRGCLLPSKRRADPAHLPALSHGRRKIKAPKREEIEWTKAKRYQVASTQTQCIGGRGGLYSSYKYIPVAPKDPDLHFPGVLTPSSKGAFAIPYSPMDLPGSRNKHPCLIITFFLKRRRIITCTENPPIVPYLTESKSQSPTRPCATHPQHPHSLTLTSPLPPL